MLTFSENPTDKYCYINWIETHEQEQRQGYGKLALKQFIDSTFLKSSVCFINALILDDNLASQALFKSLGFSEYDETLSLDGGRTWIDGDDICCDGNYYLPRYVWEMRYRK